MPPRFSLNVVYKRNIGRINRFHYLVSQYCKMPTAKTSLKVSDLVEISQSHMQISLAFHSVVGSKQRLSYIPLSSLPSCGDLKCA